MVHSSILGSTGSAVKAHNVKAILLALLNTDNLSRVQLAQLTGLSTTTITNLISELIDNGIVAEEGTEKPSQPPSVGRPRTALRLVPDARFVIGIHIGVGSVRIAIGDLRANLLEVRSLAHPLDRNPEKVFQEISKLVDQTIQDRGLDTTQLLGIGIGASGLVDPSTGVNLIAPNLGWRNVPIQEICCSGLDIPICVDNNVRAMALGEAMFGNERDIQSLAFVYARIGVGAGFITNGNLYRGVGAGAGEIGHMTMILEAGEPCRCGNNGCLETLVSEPVILRQAEEIARQKPKGVLAQHMENGKILSIEQVFNVARDGDQDMLKIIKQKARYMGIALANLVNIFNPETIVLGGLYAQGADLLLPNIQNTMQERSFANLGKRVQLRTASFGRNAGVVGAAALALSAFFYQQPEIV
ncbi:MAG: ROK family protein [Anaerolineales bacterium]|jgi:glucokinase-like ROK family protein